MSEWISVKDKSPEIGQIVVVWLERQREPCCVRYGRDPYGQIWNELVAVDREMDREDIVAFWMPLPSPSNHIVSSDKKVGDSP